MILPVILRRFGTRLKRPPILVVLALNLVPVFCVIWFGWSAGVLILLYWFENLVIGAFNILKMAISAIALRWLGIAAALFLIPFFFFHYGLFAFVHGVFVLLIGFGPQAVSGDVISPMGLLRFVERMAAWEPGFGRSLMAIVAAQGVSFLFDWLLPGKARETNPMSQMFEPYSRVVLLHFTIFAATLPVVFLGSPVWGVAALGIMKTIFEVGGGPKGFDSETLRAHGNEVFEAAREAMKGKARR